MKGEDMKGHVFTLHGEFLIVRKLHGAYAVC